MNLKQIIAEFSGLPENKILNSPKADMGDFCIPCFELAKEQKKSPFVLACELKQNLEQKQSDFVEKLEVVGGYLNFFLKKPQVAKEIIQNNQTVLKLPRQNKTIAIDYCSANLAKYLHVGHMSTTFLGESIKRIQTALGNKVIGINYVGDYGTPFGKMVVAIKKWGDKTVIGKNGIDYIQNMYVKFAENENDELLDEARFASKQIEDKIGEDYEMYQEIIEISLAECRKIMNSIGITFDDWRGESFYNDKISGTLAELENKNISRVENGATIVDLEAHNLGVAVVKRSDGGSMYITRDLCAVEDRFSLYNFDEMLYVVAVQQKQHFAQLFKIIELLGKDYAGKLKHISYGMFSTPEGKIASRKGKQALFVDMFKVAFDRASEIIKNKNFVIENKEDVAKKVALSAIAFSILKVERGKDKIFDLEKAISFDGETAPYVQYTFARCCSIIRKAENLAYINDGDSKNAQNIFAEYFELFKTLNNFGDTVLSAQKDFEPCFIARDLLLICKSFNKLYGEVKILDTENKNLSIELLEVVKAVKNVLEFGMPLVLISPVVEM